jgi:hypothetical protein
VSRKFRNAGLRLRLIFCRFLGLFRPFQPSPQHVGGPFGGLFRLLRIFGFFLKQSGARDGRFFTVSFQDFSLAITRAAKNICQQIISIGKGSVLTAWNRGQRHGEKDGR